MNFAIKTNGHVFKNIYLTNYEQNVVFWTLGDHDKDIGWTWWAIKILKIEKTNLFTFEKIHEKCVKKSKKQVDLSDLQRQCAY